MGVDSVDLTARTSGLLPLWLLLVLLGIWLATIVYAWRRRESWPGLVYQILAIGSLAIANILFFWRPLFTGAHLPKGGGDLNSFFFTLHAYSADRITSGEIPLWNPYLHGGMPHLGNYQAAVLYPPNLIAYLVSQPFSYSALEWLAILHYFVASLGVYLLLRSLGAGRIGAVAGGILFAYSGFFVAHLGHFSMISAAVWLPWLFWSVHRLLDRRSWFDAVVLAVLVFLTASGGHQQTLLFALSAIGLWWVFLLLRQSGLRIPGVGRSNVAPDANAGALNWLRSRNPLVSLGQFVGAIAAGLLIAAPMIIPSLQLARRSVRSTLSIDQAQEFSVQPVALLQLILPTVFGSNPTDYWGAFSSGEIWGYIGVTTLIVAGIGVALRPSAIHLFFAVLAVLSILYAVGPASPIHGWLYQFIPGFDLIRAPARVYVFFNLGVAVLAGMAISELVSRARYPDARALQIADRAIRFVLVIVGATALVIIPFFYTRILGVNDPPNRPVITVENLWMMMLFLLGLLGVLYLWRQGMLRSAALGLGLVFVLVLDLFSATMPFNPTGEDLIDGYREPEIVAYLNEQWDPQDPFRIDVRHPDVLPNLGLPHGFHVSSGVFDPMQPAAYTTAHNVTTEAPENPGWDMLNTRYLITSTDNEDTPPGFDLAFESETGRLLLERETALPRAWFVSEVGDVGLEAQIDVLRSPDFDPANRVLIDDPPVEPDEQSTGAVELTGYEPERITLDVDVDGPGYVVIAEGNYPDWTAEIDGEPADVLTANYGLRAIPVEGNASEIALRYEPGLVQLSWIGMVFGLIFLGGMTAMSRFTGPWSARSTRDRE